MNNYINKLSLLTVMSLIATDFSSAIAADDPGACASAKIVSGEMCKDLKIRIDLSQCKGGSSGDAQVKCGSGIGTASHDSNGGTYSVELKETWGGAWALSGPVKFATAPVAPAAAPAAGAAPSTPAAATGGMQSASAITFSGVARLRHDDVFAKVPTGAVHTNYTSLRIRPNLNIKVNPDLAVVIEPQYSKTFGAVAFVPSTTSANTATASVSDPNYNGAVDSFTMSQAFLDIKMDYGLSLQAGRLSLAYGDHIVLGSGEWTDFARRFDALKLRYTQDKSYIDIIAAKVIENNKTTNASSDGSGTNDDRDFNGVYASWNVNENLKALEAYYLYIYDNRAANATPNSSPSSGTAVRPAYFGTQGLRFVSAFDKVGWKGEYAQNFGGEGTDFIASGQKDKNDMMDTEVSYNFGDSMKTRLGLEYFTAGKNWRELYPTPVKALGIVDVVGRRNLTGFGLHYTGSFGDKYALEADYYIFKRTSTDATAYGLAAGFGSASDSSDDVGSELDLAGKYIASKNLTWTLGMNVFMPGTYTKNAQNTATAGTGGRVSHYGYVLADVKF